MLDGAMRLLAESSREHLRRVLTAGAVAGAAGLHRQTFYLHWNSQAEFVDDFVRYVTDPSTARPRSASTRSRTTSRRRPTTPPPRCAA